MGSAGNDEPSRPDVAEWAKPAVGDEVLSNARIVIVEDQPANVALLTRMMQAAGIREIHGVTDPRAAVQRCTEADADLMLLDWHMPAMDGLEVLMALRAALSPQDFLPVIVLTADDDPAVRDQALAMGAKDFLTKPFDLAEVTLRVRNLLETRALHQHVQRHNASLQADLSRRMEQEQRQAADRQEKLERIQTVLGGDALTMVFQPIVDLRSAEVVGVEALARFHCEPQRPPNVWFDEAACVGRGPDLELAAVRAALRQLDAFPTTQFVSVNVSPETAITPELGQLFDGVPAQRTVLELTEHAPVSDYDRLLPALDALRGRGVRIAIDDTGAGYSHLRHVLHVRPEIIKLDIGLTRGISDDPARRALATALVAFGREIGATVVAEGIETPEEFTTLVELGVPLGQGYYLGRPGPPPEADSVAKVTEPTSR